MTNDEKAAEAGGRIRNAIAALEAEGQKATARAVAERAGCSLRTVTRVMGEPAWPATPPGPAAEIIKAVQAGRFLEAAKLLASAPPAAWTAMLEVTPTLPAWAEAAEWALEDGPEGEDRVSALLYVIALGG